MSAPEMPRDEALPFTAPDYGDYRIAGKTYRLNKGTVVNEDTLPELDPQRGCICSLGTGGSNPACQHHYPSLITSITQTEEP